MEAPEETKPLTVAVLADELLPLMANWKELGRNMALPEHVLSAIDIDHPRCFEKLCAVLDRWLKYRVNPASWDDIISILWNMHEGVLMRKIREKYGESTTVTSVMKSD